jgi:uncharacterized protein YfeS
MDCTPPDKALFDAEVERNPRFLAAYELMKKGLTNKHIGREMGVAPPTIRGWFKRAGFMAREYAPRRDIEEKVLADIAKRAAEGEDEEDLIAGFPKMLINDIKRHVSEVEDETLDEIAEAQLTVADKYQHFVAAASIKMMRDAMKNIKGPRTVKELSELDQLIRRNLGLNAKGGAGGSKLTIDISILNNTISDKGGMVKKMKQDIMDAEVVVPPEKD